MIWKKFKAMGSDIVISADLAGGQEGLIVKAEKIVGDFEKRFSRFIAENELAQLNDKSGINYTASTMMVDILNKAKQLYDETNRIFDPCVIGSLESIGYARSFDENNDRTSPCKEADKVIIIDNNITRPKLNELNISGDIIDRPKDFRLDLGGIGKGYIVDYLSDHVFQGTKNYFISAGGDLIVNGQAENKAGWEIGVEDPAHPEKDIFSLKTKGEKLAVATSGIIKKRGNNNVFNWHHIIDPSTGLPVDNEILSVTLISTSTIRADVFAKTVLILGPVAGLKFIEDKEDSACIIFLRDKEPILSRQAKKYL
jgi:FAD:protein FMN transferase